MRIGMVSVPPCVATTLARTRGALPLIGPRAARGVLGPGDGLLLWSLAADALGLARAFQGRLYPPRTAFELANRLEATRRLDDLSSHGLRRAYLSRGERVPAGRGGELLVIQECAPGGTRRRLVSASRNIQVRAPAIVEPYLPGTAVRVLRIGAFVAAYGRQGDSREAVAGATQLPVPAELLSDAVFVLERVGLQFGAVDYRLGPRVAAEALEPLPPLPPDPAAEAALGQHLLELVDGWWACAVGAAGV